MKSYTSCFLGIPLPQEYLREFGQLLNEIHRMDLSIETVQSQTPHITIYYLNQQSQHTLEEIKENIEPLSESLNRVTLTIGGFDHFTKDNPKVLFLDVKYPKAVIDYWNKVSEVLKEYSASDNNLPFHPHMTLGIIKTIQGQQNFKENKKEIIGILRNVSWDFKLS